MADGSEPGAADPYEHRFGPYHVGEASDGAVRCSFRAERGHLNTAGVVHSGCLLSFADVEIGGWAPTFSFSTQDYALTLGAGLLLVAGGGGVGVYKYTVGMANYRVATKFAREYEVQAAQRTDKIESPIHA